MSYGPSPWLQQHWDIRAALNFVLGGIGAGVLVALAVSGAREPLWQSLGLAFVGGGLTAVWLEIGRPWRAFHVLFNPFTSWMTRESFVAALLFALGIAALISRRAELAIASALAALAFVYCQGRMLHAAKGIPAWREPMVTWLIVATALAEGAGLLLVVSSLAGRQPNAAAAWCALAVIARAGTWSAYRRRVARKSAQPCLAPLDRAGTVLIRLGTVASLALLAAGALLPDLARATVPLAGVAAAAAGWHFKIVLVTRAAFNQGFALPQLPVRGRR